MERKHTSDWLNITKETFFLRFSLFRCSCNLLHVLIHSLLLTPSLLIGNVKLLYFELSSYASVVNEFDMYLYFKTHYNRPLNQVVYLPLFILATIKLLDLYCCLAINLRLLIEFGVSCLSRRHSMCHKQTNM